MNTTPGFLGQIRTRLSFRKIFPVAFFLMIFTLVLRQCVLIDPDLWWHLQTGQDIINSRSIPSVDIYSFTRAGSEWVAHEWLSEVLMYAIFRLSGWGGLAFVFSALITIALYITYRRCAGQPYIAALAVLLAAAASSPLFGIRPQMITLLLASIYIALLSRYSDEGRSRSLWWLLPMMLLWVNLHAGFALGLALIGLYMVSAMLDRKWSLVQPLAILLIACAAVVPLNPNGFRMFSYPFETLSSPAMAGLIQEWASPDFHRVMYLPLALLLLTLTATLVLSPKRASVGDVFLLLVTGFGALRSARHIPIFALIATPILAKHAWHLISLRGWDLRLDSPDKPARAAGLLFSLTFLLAPSTLATVRVWHFVSHQPAYEAQRYPVAALNFLESQNLPGPIYNKYGWGGYLIRKLYPSYQVYIDGRADVYGDAFMTEAFGTYDGKSGWREPLDRLAVRTVIISPDAPLASLLHEDRQWNKVYDDGQAVIFTRTKNTVAASDSRVDPTLDSLQK